jgi:cytochrome c biogenesis protein CcdA
MLLTTGLALLAGALSVLSPCVLPLVPIVLAGATTEHRFGPAALALGLAVSFTVVGLFVATVGFAIGLDAGVFRALGGLIMLVFGALLLVPSWQTGLATAAGPLASWTEERFRGLPSAGLGGQFAAGAVLGAVWTPCVGPTLGAASVLAAQGRDLGQVAITMTAFGIGAAAPLLLLGLLSREALLRWRGRLAGAGRGGKLALGALLAAFGLAILTGADKRVEAALVEASPQWLTDLTTRF